MAADALGVLLRARAGIARPLFVTDPGLRDLPITRAALGTLEAAGLNPGLFTQVKPNPTDENVEAGTLAN